MSTPPPLWMYQFEQCCCPVANILNYISEFLKRVVNTAPVRLVQAASALSCDQCLRAGQSQQGSLTPLRQAYKYVNIFHRCIEDQIL
jgi:hypothetical protein